MLDLNHILLFLACISPLVMLAQTLRRGGLYRPWRLASFAVLLVMGVAWWSQSAHWVHVRVNEPAKDEGRHATRVSVSMPLPINLASWFLRTFGGTIPGLREQRQVLDSLPDLLKELDRNHEPIVVEVNDKDNSEVKVYIT